MLFGRLTLVVVVMAAVLLAGEIHQVKAARILMALPIGVKSHNNFFMPIAEHLAQRNHTVSDAEQDNNKISLYIVTFRGVQSKSLESNEVPESCGVCVQIRHISGSVSITSVTFPSPLR